METFVEADVTLRLIDSRLGQLRRVLDEFPEDQLWQRPRPDMVSLGNLICHVAGSMGDWIENGLARGDWVRDRAYEFARAGDLDRRQLGEQLDGTWDVCQRIVRGVDVDEWNQTRTFRDKPYTFREIVLHQLEHVAYHVGQAAFLRRIVADLPPAS